MTEPRLSAAVPEPCPPSVGLGVLTGAEVFSSPHRINRPNRPLLYVASQQSECSPLDDGHAWPRQRSRLRVPPCDPRRSLLGSAKDFHAPRTLSGRLGHAARPHAASGSCSSCAEQIGTIERRLDSAGAVHVAASKTDTAIRRQSFTEGARIARADQPAQRRRDDPESRPSPMSEASARASRANEDRPRVISVPAKTR